MVELFVDAYGVDPGALNEVSNMIITIPPHYNIH